MSYKIVYDDIWNLSGITTQSNSQLRDKLKTLSSHFETFIGENRLQGEMVSSVKSYLQEVHGLLIESINLLLTEYETQLLLYKDGYFNIDSNNHSVLPEEVFETVKKELKQKQSEYSSNNDSLNSVSGEISDLVPFSVRKGDTINRYYTDISTNVEDLKSKVGNYESQHTNDLDSFKEHLSSFESLVNHYISQPQNIPTSYKSLDITKINEIKDFAISYQSLQNHLNASSVFLDAALKREEKRIEALKEEAIEARKQEAKSKYLTGALIAVGGLIAIVATAGAATPLVVGAGLVAGTGTVLYGASNMNEATNSYNLAMNGDITSKAFNPIRDTIFFGNQKAYDITGNIMIIGTMFTGGAAQVSKLVSLGNGALKSTATVATQFVGIAGASYVGGEVFKEGTYQLSKNVFELTDAESRRNSEIAKIVGNIVTGIVVAKPVINYTNNKFGINTVVKRPSWRESEVDVGKQYRNYDSQKSFLNGKEVPYGTKGSVRPEYYTRGHSVEVKNYNIQTSKGRSSLIRNVTTQIKQRITNLPQGTRQTIVIDVRGQSIDNSILKEIRNKIITKAGIKVEILFVK